MCLYVYSDSNLKKPFSNEKKNLQFSLKCYFFAYGLFKIDSLFQISDIVVGQEDVSAKEALLRWAQKTTHRYPGVKVDDFTRSWRDGLAFNAIIHRNRPDLVDWKKLDRRQVRERIDLAFHVMEREYGVTRLLDPEGKIE